MNLKIKPMRLTANPTKPSLDEVIRELKMIASFHNSSSNRKKAALNAEWLQELLSYKDETLITTEWLKKYFTFYSSEDDGDVWIQKEILKKCIYIYEMAEYRWQVHVETDEKREEFDLQTLGQLRMFLTLCGVPREFIKNLK